MYYLHIKPLGGTERRALLAPGVTTVGRMPVNDIVLEEYGVSGRHAEIEAGRDEVVVRDVGSTNGVFVNGRKTQTARLFPGDRVLIGSVLAVLQEALSDRIRVRDSGSIPAAESMPANGETVPPSVMEKAYIPAVEPSSEDGQAGGAGDGSFFEEMIGDVLAPGEGAGLDRAIEPVARLLGADDAYLLARKGRSDYALAASTRPGEPLLVSRALLRECFESGTELCLDESDRPGYGAVCLPLRYDGSPVGALLVEVKAAKLDAARSRTARLRPVLGALALLVERSTARSELRRVRAVLASGGEWPRSPEGLPSAGYEFIGSSRATRDVVTVLDRLATTDEPLLVVGERGTGKDRAARRLHALGRRRTEPFLQYACGAPGDDADWPDLFGDEPPGEAAEPTLGRIELVTGGTVYLDEPAALSAPAQDALARWLATGTLVRRGGSRAVAADVRLVMGSRVAPGSDPAGHTFTEALAERLRAIETVVIPPLRERREDVIPLAQHLVRRFAAENRARVLGLSMDACRTLRDYEWRGNVLELEQVLARAVLLARDPIIDVDVLPLDIAGGRLESSPFGGLASACERPWKDAKDAFEKAYFEQVLDQSGGNVSKATRHAGIARKNFYSKLRQHGLAQK